MPELQPFDVITSNPIVEGLNISGAPVLPATRESSPDKVMEEYCRWLEGQPWLSTLTRREYESRARLFFKQTRLMPDSAAFQEREQLFYRQNLGMSDTRLKGFRPVLEQLAVLCGLFEPDEQLSRVNRLSEEDCRRIQENARNSRFFRDYVLMCLMLRSGLTLSECRYLKVGSLLESPIATVIYYGKPHEVPLEQETWSALQDWLNCPQRRFIDSEYVFATPSGAPLSRTAFDNQIRRIGIAIGLVLTPRMVQRASFARPFDRY